MTHTQRGLARFAADLPAVQDFVHLGEGNTPLLPLSALASRLGMSELHGKLETVNPTGSYKDRVAAMSVSLARSQGLRGWIATSSGNAGVAMAAYGARAGLPGFLCLVASAPIEKKLPLVPYPVHVLAVSGIGHQGDGATGKRLFEEVRRAGEIHHLYLGVTAHAFNPQGMRGCDTIAYELAEQLPEASHVYVPVGGGGLVAAMTRGFAHREMRVRTIACQPAGCAPIARFLEQEIVAPEVARCASEISGLQLPHPPDGLLAAESVLRSGGWGTCAEDTAVLAAQRLLVETEGVFVEPAAAVPLAALIADLENGRIDRDARVVLVLTGAGWKDLKRFADEADRIRVSGLDEVSERIDEWAGVALANETGAALAAAHEGNWS
ncbi:pyridoxal-phosphate dependent enzyme [Amycolatopsis pithecellobii]|uniref:Pyridoxal-phosphate dependent enzyme n=1 Tax=Amycolatopsis pithecellobii TaxID=664692 RepID=A0A6N7ZB52_9PSEU|nr:pyridoxal-phosphate dependent enzyme [Amycolatopsis pithecellobii]MTD58991.1 pyridoxal-phosphate dependent enzyme [Amycolatopsis pithecellobii]